MKKRTKKKWEHVATFMIIFVVVCLFLVFRSPTDVGLNDLDWNDSFEKEEIREIENTTEDMIKDPGKKYWDHMPLTYRFEDTEEFISTCQDHIKERVKGAFDIVKNETSGAVYFVEVDYDEDIIIRCSNKIQTDGRAAVGISTAGEGGPTLIQGNKILEGELNFYPYRNCGTFPDVELHEIMHVLGFGHNNSSRLNLMYPTNLKCDGTFDDYLKEELIMIYG